MAKEKNKARKTSNSANIGYEAQLWQMADALRGSMDAAEYKHIVRGAPPTPHRAPDGVGTTGRRIA